MLRHAVTHVPLKTVARKGKPEPHHQPVARHLGDDRSRRDRQHKRISRHHRYAIATTVDLLISIDEDQFRQNRKRLDRARQRPKRSAQDIVAVDALDCAECDRDLCAGADLFIELLALPSIELFGVVEPARNSVGIQNDGGRNHRPGKRATPGLIATGNRPNAIF